jgi:hypothetical protein
MRSERRKTARRAEQEAARKANLAAGVTPWEQAKAARAQRRQEARLALAGKNGSR